MRLRALMLVVSVAALALPASALAWKPPTHQVGVQLPEQMMAVGDTVTIADVSGDPAKSITVNANAELAKAIRLYPDAYRAGVMGPDAFPDTYFGQSFVHPDTRNKNDRAAGTGADGEAITDEWLSYLWEQAWKPINVFAVQGVVPIDWAPAIEDRYKAIAFVAGFIAGHGNGDVWAHTLVNSPALAQGVFPDFTNFKKGDISVRHVIVEGYIDKHRPGYDPLAPTTYSFDVPTEFVAQTMLLSQFAREHGKHPVLDPFIDKYVELAPFVEELRFDNQHQDCAIDTAEDCTAVDHFGHTHFVCELEGCGPDITDSPINVFEWGIDKALEAYNDAWLQDIEDGMVAWVEVNAVIAKELYSGKKPQLAPITDAVHDWLLKHYLSMMGYPDFVGNGLLFVSDIASAVSSFFFSCDGALWGPVKSDPTLGSVLGPACEWYEDAKADIVSRLGQMANDLTAGMLTTQLGLRDLPAPVFDALDTSNDNNLSALEVLNVVREPEDYIGDVRIFPLPVRQLLDNAMALLPGTDDDAADRFRAYQIDKFAALRNTQTLGMLGMLDETGLNDFFKKKAAQGGDATGLGNLYSAYLNSNTGQPTGWYVPNNIMLGWMRAMDGNHQWSTTSVYAEDDDGPGPAPAIRHAYGTGRMWLWEDCVARNQVFKKIFFEPVPWHNPGESSFEDTWDAPTNLTDTQAPGSMLTITGPKVLRDGKTYVGGGTTFEAKAADNYDPASALALSTRIYPTGGTAPAWTSAAANPHTLSLGSGRADGAYTVEMRAVDRCGNESVDSENVVLDNSPPTIAITSPADGSKHDVDVKIPVTFSATDDGAGVDTGKTTVTLDQAGGLLSGGAQIDTYFLDAGLHTLTVSAEDKLGNAATKTVTIDVEATIAGLIRAVNRAPTLGHLNSGYTSWMLSTLYSAQSAENAGSFQSTKTLLLMEIDKANTLERKGRIDSVFKARFVGWINDKIARLPL